MTARNFVADLGSKKFPHTFRHMPSSVIYPDAAETPQRQGNMHGAEGEQQEGYNQVYYVENALPIARGFSSVVYNAVSAGPVGEKLQYVFEVRNDGGDSGFIGVAGSKVYAYNADYTWTLLPMLRDTAFVPQAVVVRGQSILYFGLGTIFRWDYPTNSLQPLTLTALTLTPRGITSCGAHLVVYSDTQIFSSAVLDYTDFQPSIATGASGSSILALRGKIVTCLPIGQDFIIYTNFNAIYVRSTDNLAFPMAAQEILGSLGIVNAKHVAYNTNLGLHIAYTNAGFQELSAQGASSIFQELGDGLLNGNYNYVNTVNDYLDYRIADALNISIRFVANRYLTISVGTDIEEDIFWECYIYDSGLDRWGRLRVDHTAIVEWTIVPNTDGIRTYANLASTYSAYNAIPADAIYSELGTLATRYASLNKQRLSVVANVDGAINTVTTAENGGAELESYPPSPDIPFSRLYLGRIKMFRNQGSAFQYLTCNKLLQGVPVIHGHDMNGAIIRDVDLVHNNRHYGMWSGRLNADTFTVEFRGVFVLTECAINAANGGTHQQYAASTKKHERLLFSEVYGTQAGITFHMWCAIQDDDTGRNGVVVDGILHPNLFITYSQLPEEWEYSISQFLNPVGIEASLGYPEVLNFNLVGYPNWGDTKILSAPTEDIAGYAFASVLVATTSASTLYEEGNPLLQLPGGGNAVIIPYQQVIRMQDIWEHKLVVDGYFEQLPANTTVVSIYIVSGTDTGVTVLETITFDITTMEGYEAGMQLWWLKNNVLYQPVEEMLWVVFELRLDDEQYWLRLQIDSTQTVIGYQLFSPDNPGNFYASRFSALAGSSPDVQDFLYGSYVVEEDIGLAQAQTSKDNVVFKNFFGGNTLTYASYTGRGKYSSPQRVLDQIYEESAPIDLDLAAIIESHIIRELGTAPDLIYCKEKNFLRVY